MDQSDESNAHGEQSTPEATQPFKMNLCSLEMFPVLGAPEGEKTCSSERPSWGRSNGVSNTNGTTTTSTGSRKRIISQVFQLPAELQRKHRDPSDKLSLAEVCSQVAQKTHTTIDASKSGQTGTYTFVIRGNLVEVTDARRQLWSRLAEAASIAMEVPEECLGLIIGPLGRTINAIMKETSTKINIPKIYEGQIIISGDFEGISLAKERIGALIQDKISKTATTLRFERCLLPFIFETLPSVKLSQLAQEYAESKGVKIGLSVDKDDPELAQAVISGDRQQVAAVCSELSNRQVKCKETIKAVPLALPKSLHHMLIGPKGETLHALEEEINCLLVLPAPQDPSDQIRVYGPEEYLLKGLQTILERTSLIDSQSIVLEPHLKLLFLQRSRQKLRDLEGKYSVRIYPTDTGLAVDGRRAEVAMTMMELNTLVQSLRAFHFETFPIDPAYLKHIIGKKGHNLQQMQADFDVDVLIPDEDPRAPEERQVVLAGRSEASLTTAKDYLSKKVANLADLRSVELHIEAKLHGQLIGSKGVHLKNFEQLYPSVMIKFAEGDLIYLRGPSTEVSALAADLQKRAETIRHELFLQSYTTELALQGDLFSTAKGSGNEKEQPARWLVNLARQHSVKVKLLEGGGGEEQRAKKPIAGNNNNASGNTGKLQIQGLKKDADAFKTLAEAQLIKFADQGSESIEIDPKYHAILVGRDKKNIRHLAKKYNVQLRVPPPLSSSSNKGTMVQDEEDKGITTGTSKINNNNNKITISGPRANLKAAREELLEFIAYQKLHSQRDSMLIPDGVIPFVLGKGGIVIDGIRLETDTNINISKSADEQGERLISFEGSTEGIAEAKRRIEMIVKERGSRAEEELSVDGDKYKKIFSLGIELYRQLTSKFEACGVVIIASRTKEQGPVFLFRGPKEQVAEAKGEMLKLLDKTDQLVSVNVEIPVKYHGEIIGTKGQNIRKICDQYGVSVSFLKTRRRSVTEEVQKERETTTEDKVNPDMITIEGLADKVAEARSQLLTFVREAKVVPVPVPFRHEIVELLRGRFSELSVKVTQVREGLSISGGQQDMQVAVKEIQNTLANLEDETAGETIKVDSKLHGAIIGRGGVQIGSLRKETGCRIIVPPPKTTSDEIRLVGDAEAISKAKVAIEKILAGLPSKVL